ncbi:hypothetical protein [Clostridium butyricum]|uniref:hypothetical protein n=1 Tax=Clostridium butyricum TaxID=1492 RepID=UPI0022E3B66E|nr:hypothetical protein [Clostridium butyricum]
MSKIKTVEQLIAEYPEAYKKAQVEITGEKNKRMELARLMANSVNSPTCEVKNIVKNKTCSYTSTPKEVREVEDSVSLLVRAAESINR